MVKAQSPAEIASQRALEAMYACLNTGKSFRLEAGAGAGKTYSLIKALQFLIARNNDTFQKQSQQIACITYTNVAKDEIVARIDRSPLVFCETNHAFCWSLISGFQKLIRTQIEAMPTWKEKIEEIGGTLGQRVIEYNLGHRSIRDRNVSIHHDDVLPLTISLMAHEKFRRIIADRFPIILIDEYQDTNNEWIEAIKTHLLGKPRTPLFGFFGDHWQKIYGGGCGKLDHPCLTEIGKEANFRSVKVIVDSLNRMRPALQQFVEDPDAEGGVRIFHTNNWQGERRKGVHWSGDLPASVGLTTLERVKTMLAREGWDLSPCHTKILMLTHKLLANQQGYSNLAAIFRYNESFTKKENQHIAFFVDKLEPACDAFAAHKYGMMFEALGGISPLLRSHADKASWHNAMTQLLAIRDTGTVGDVIEHLRTRKKPRLPDTVEKRERELRDFDKTAGVEMPRVLEELEKLQQIAYSEVKALRHYLDGHSPFETKHGVKGAEFENVLVVVGRGWNQYNFAEMLELAGAQVISAAKEDAYERNRNLFYVACSRPKKRLAILFTQSLSPDALATLESWFGKETIMPAP
ncbi:ATP-dependent helicase [Salmonella enterica]|uniref:DNA 3'-5' helicase II n=1 Tax=Salmonella enterica subsp. salamae serovar 42:f,g,t:-- TaxID=41518 RepID=A0A737H2N1_SALER|nr:UvrD-helicase domain-containing protein [Salmonella enterica]EBE1550541.1 ATP-dependent helicase [Salmonella enterica subsp. enterica]ECJ2453062.1 ATP-dependent helicase [Salmonella enterica subsp. salamae]EBN8531805.1 ATP-dependent helicase [Salmonella enterica]EBP0438251.1 ATP-dependent helicase [Salmonella enterica]ECJ2730056.1 ATP-dependent helicase [Salmonella enterica subsp. salamae]